MFPTGKCPKCQKVVSQVKLEHVEAGQIGGPSWHGVSYVCPHCSTLLGVGIDPVALKTDTVKELLKALKGQK